MYKPIVMPTSNGRNVLHMQDDDEHIYIYTDGTTFDYVIRRPEDEMRELHKDHFIATTQGEDHY